MHTRRRSPHNIISKTLRDTLTHSKITRTQHTHTRERPFKSRLFPLTAAARRPPKMRTTTSLCSAVDGADDADDADDPTEIRVRHIKGDAGDGQLNSFVPHSERCSRPPARCHHTQHPRTHTEKHAHGAKTSMHFRMCVVLRL